jgi:hypothetical protein
MDKTARPHPCGDARIGGPLATILRNLLAIIRDNQPVKAIRVVTELMLKYLY